MSTDAPTTLLVIHDRHAAGRIDTIVSTLSRQERGRTVVVTTDPLLCMRLTRLGLTAHQTLDGLDRERVLEEDAAALDGVRAAYGAAEHDWSTIEGRRYAPLLEYTLIPKFIGVVRDLHGLDRRLRVGSFTRVLLLGRGALTATAALLARQRGLRVARTRRGPWHTLRATIARTRADAHVRWVNTDLRALVFEPAVLKLLLLRGLLTPRPSSVSGSGTPTLLVTGDRFTRDIVERLQRHGAPVVVAGGTFMGRRLFRHVRGIAELESFGKLVDVLAIARIALKALARVKGLVRDPQRGAGLATAGLSYWPLVRRTVALHLLVWPPLLHHVGVLVERAAAARPNSRLLVSHDVTAYTKMLIDAAEVHQIKSFGVQHGILGEPNGHAVARVSTLATWGPYSERWYRQHAPQRARFVVTGNPKFDPLAERIRDRSPRTRASDQPFTIVICTGFVSLYSVCASDSENLLMLQTVQDWATSHTHVRVIHKLHPGEEAAYYRFVAATLGWNESAMTTVKESPLYDVLEAADVLVAGYSTTVLEAVALGTPAIVIDAIAGRRHIPLDASPDVAIATSAEEIAQQLGVLYDKGSEIGGRRSGEGRRSDAPRQAFIEDQLNHLDGRATERLCDLLSRP